MPLKTGVISLKLRENKIIVWTLDSVWLIFKYDFKSEIFERNRLMMGLETALRIRIDRERRDSGDETYLCVEQVHNEYRWAVQEPEGLPCYFNVTVVAGALRVSFFSDYSSSKGRGGQCRVASVSMSLSPSPP